MKSMVLSMLAAVMLIALGAQTAAAAPLTLPVVAPGGAWTQFGWLPGANPRPTFAQDAAGDEFDSFLLTATQPVFLNVTDAFFPGEAFDVFVNGSLSLSTPGRPVGTLRVTNPNLAFANPVFSSGRLTLQPGIYNINILLREGPPGSGGAFIQATPTPEPATMLLLGTGLAAIAAKMRRRRKTD